jgi:hypothetical protein
MLTFSQRLESEVSQVIGLLARDAMHFEATR